jgi:methionyl-tRNA synthetase
MLNPNENEILKTMLYSAILQMFYGSMRERGYIREEAVELVFNEEDKRIMRERKEREENKN